jgi:hypothetical protein
MEKDIINEFLSVDWDEVFIDDFTECFICGMRKDNLNELKEAVKILKEKAWKYDSLSK